MVKRSGKWVERDAGGGRLGSYNTKGYWTCSCYLLRLVPRLRTWWSCVKFFPLTDVSKTIRLVPPAGQDPLK